MCLGPPLSVSDELGLDAPVGANAIHNRQRRENYGVHVESRTNVVREGGAITEGYMRRMGMPCGCTTMPRW